MEFSRGKSKRISALLVCICGFIRTISSAPCAANTQVGSSSPGSDSNAGPLTTYVSYLIDPNNDNDYKILCCGVIETVNYVAGNAGTTFDLQVWDAGTGSVHTLLRSATITASGTALTNPLSVDTGYRYGWYGNPNVIKHKNAGNSAKERIDRFATTSMTTVGNTLDWSTTGGADFEGNVAYSVALQLVLGPGNSPTLTSSAGNTVNLNTADATGTAVSTITAADLDTGDTLTTISMGAHAQFSFDGSAVTTAISLAGLTRTETLTFSVQDACGNTGSLSVSVVITNDPPSINNMPASSVLSEDISALTLLHTIDATDSVDAVTCSMDTSTSTHPFTVQVVAGSTSYGIYSNAAPGFDYATNYFYSLLINCDDVDAANTQQKRYYVFLVKNNAPVVSNLQGFTIVSTTTAAGSTIFTVAATDAESDTISYSMTCPNDLTCPFSIDTNTGAITLTSALTTSTTTGYDIYVTVSDAKNTLPAKVLSVIISDINDAVEISNLPLTSNIPVNENAAASTPIFTVTSQDQDTTQTLTYSMTSTGTGLTYFTIDTSTGVISTTASTLDYETLLAATETSFTLTVSVTDSIATDSQTLTIDVIDVNEAPAYSQASYSLSTNEAAANTVIGTPAFGTTDEDSGDTKIYDMNCGNGYFFMDSSSGQVKFQADYDLDTGLSSSVTCALTVTDFGGLTDTASLIISIADTNDHTPTFSPSSYTFYTSYYAAAGTTVGTLTASDGDAATYGTLTYVLNQSSLPAQYFTVDGSGNVALSHSLSTLGYGQTINIAGLVYDSGGLSATASIQIIVGDTTTAAPTTTTIRYRKFHEDSRNMPWLVMCSLATVAIIGTLSWVIYTCRGSNSFSATMKTCRRMRTRRPQLFNKTRAVNPPRPGPRMVDLTVRIPPPLKRYQQWRSGDEGAPAGTVSTNI